MSDEFMESTAGGPKLPALKFTKVGDVHTGIVTEPEAGVKSAGVWAVTGMVSQVSDADGPSRRLACTSTRTSAGPISGSVISASRRLKLRPSSWAVTPSARDAGSDAAVVSPNAEAAASQPPASRHTHRLPIGKPPHGRVRNRRRARYDVKAAVDGSADRSGIEVENRVPATAFSVITYAFAYRLAFV